MTNRLVLDVKGMTCAHCVSRVDKALRAVDGVSSVAVSLQGHQAEVEFDAPATSAALMEAVSEAGYEASAS